jgi:triacylglycerol esterase/lipase EstA (alpha/beta hydrolase family)
LSREENSKFKFTKEDEVSNNGQKLRDASSAKTLKEGARIYAPAAPVYRAPSYPVVLCHGLFGYNRIGPTSMPWFQLSYWKGAEEALQSIGCQVYTSRVAPVASLKTRAHELRRFLEGLSQEKGITKFNLIGHSMGGLDARYMISHLSESKNAFTIASLTTIATPHRGSSFMDYLRDTIGIASVKPAWNEVTIDSSSMQSESTATSTPTASPSLHPLVRALVSTFDAPAFYNLTTDYCAAFNQVSPNSPSVKYYSYAAVTDSMPKLAPLSIPHAIVTKAEGPNDGIVSLKSAKWGQFMGTLDCDHWAIVPSKFPRPGLGIPRAKSEELYLRIATHLHDEGC